jgi:hypothetical protein
MKKYTMFFDRLAALREKARGSPLHDAPEWDELFAADRFVSERYQEAVALIAALLGTFDAMLARTDGLALPLKARQFLMERIGGWHGRAAALFGITPEEYRDGLASRN